MMCLSRGMGKGWFKEAKKLLQAFKTCGAREEKQQMRSSRSACPRRRCNWKEKDNLHQEGKASISDHILPNSVERMLN